LKYKHAITERSVKGGIKPWRTNTIVIRSSANIFLAPRENGTARKVILMMPTPRSTWLLVTCGGKLDVWNITTTENKVTITNRSEIAVESRNVSETVLRASLPLDLSAK
jgi:hypothetical protein